MILFKWYICLLMPFHSTLTDLVESLREHNYSILKSFYREITSMLEAWKDCVPSRFFILREKREVIIDAYKQHMV